MTTGEVVNEMLKRTFLHLAGIGPRREQKLWEHGFHSWEDLLSNSGNSPLPSSVAAVAPYHLEQSLEALRTGSARHFELRLPPGEVWRLYPDFAGKVAFLDIETTGLHPAADEITLIGLFDGKDTRVFVRGINLQEFAREIQKYSVIVTFNGKRFDMPFVRKTFGDLPDHQAHLDLLYPLRRLGYGGGLKSIEGQLGLEREGALKDVDGFMAVLLWHEYRQGNKGALDTLIRYNLEDVVNLQYLADMAYNFALTGLPIEVKPLPVRPKYVVNAQFDADLIAYLKRLASPLPL